MRRKRQTLNELEFSSLDCIVIDLGSGFVKFGFAGEDKPRFSIRNCISSTHKVYGDDCFSSPSMNHLNINNLEWGFQINEQKLKLTSMDVFETLLREVIFPKLGFDSQFSNENLAVLIAEPSGLSNKNRIKMSKLLFEVLKVPKVYFGYQPIFSLYSQGITSGLVVDVGDQFTQVVPVYNGFGLQHAFVNQRLGGRDLTLFLQHLLRKRYENSKNKPIHFGRVQGLAFLERIKEKKCSVAPIPVNEWNNNDNDTKRNEEPYILPDRHVIELGEEKQLVPEALFNPALLPNLRDYSYSSLVSFYGGNQDGRRKKTSSSSSSSAASLLGIHQMVKKSYEKCDEYMKDIIEQHVVCSGGSSMFPGFRDRLDIELKKLGKRMHVKAPNERHINSWIGASMLASFQTFPEMCIKANEWEEVSDKSIVFRKVF